MKALLLFIFIAFGLAVQECSNVDKWAANALTSRHFQRNRGTCWAFGAIGVLESSYIKNGYAKGYLTKNQYVQFSEQAYGIGITQACMKHNDVCNDNGDFARYNSTDGGELYWLYSLGEMYSKILPVSVCPYIPESGEANEHECPNYNRAIASNPIRFNITNMLSGYGSTQTKKIMVETRAAVGWSTLMHNTYFYYPCSDPDWANRSGCSIDKRVRCPQDKYYNSDYCAVYVSSMFNQDGEFFVQGNIVTDGGHAMVAVGFNDHFVTKKGTKGGFIIKNSWEDLTYGTDPSGRGARGSHSVAYWMQEISGWAERKICPNPLNPNNWLSCALQEPGITHRAFFTPANRTRVATDVSNSIDTLPDSFDTLPLTCLDNKFLNKLTDEQYQATEFQCLDETFCSKESKYRYFFIRNMRSVDGDTMQLAMLQYNVIDESQTILLTPYMQDSALAYIFAPIASQQEKLKNSDDLCGYYFWPYEVAERQISLYGDFFSTYFEIVWAESSYLANKSRYPDYDYSYLMSSTKTLPEYSPMCQNPWATKRYF